MQLMFVYAVVLIVSEAVGLGEVVEIYFPSVSLIAFMAFFLAMLWVAWIIAVRLTAPRGA